MPTLTLYPNPFIVMHPGYIYRLYRHDLPHVPPPFTTLLYSCTFSLLQPFYSYAPSAPCSFCYNTFTFIKSHPKTYLKLYRYPNLLLENDRFCCNCSEMQLKIVDLVITTCMSKYLYLDI